MGNFLGCFFQIFFWTWVEIALPALKEILTPGCGKAFVCTTHLQRPVMHCATCPRHLTRAPQVRLCGHSLGYALYRYICARIMVHYPSHVTQQFTVQGSVLYSMSTVQVHQLTNIRRSKPQNLHIDVNMHVQIGPKQISKQLKHAISRYRLHCERGK